MRRRPAALVLAGLGGLAGVASLAAPSADRQPLPRAAAARLDVTVEATVADAGRLPTTLVYSYRLASAATSRQPAVDLVVAFGGIVENVKSPAGWTAKPLATMTALDWSASAGLAAGAAAAGFSFEAKPHAQSARLAGPEEGPAPGFVHTRGALPGIVDCFVVGTAPLLPPALTGTPAPPLATLAAGLASFSRGGVVGRTVGPVEIPEGDALGALLESVSRYTRECVQLGWIHHPETAERYAKAFEAIRRERSAGSLGGPMAYTRLQTLARQADIDLGNHALGPEAHALLKQNSVWLAALAVEAHP